MIRIKRVYEPVEPGDGERYLVDRLWPRGIKKEKLALTAWLKEAAPSNELRRWYGHDPDKWDEFRRRYFSELEGKPETCLVLTGAAARGDVTLLFSSRELEINNAAALKLFLESHQLD